MGEILETAWAAGSMAASLSESSMSWPEFLSKLLKLAKAIYITVFSLTKL